MSVTIKWPNGMTATVEHLSWEASNPHLKNLMMRMTPDLGVPVGTHDPDEWLAEDIVSKIGGKIIKRNKKEKTIPGMVY